MAFVLINAEVGSENQVLSSIKKLNGVLEAFIVYGVYDIIVKIEGETMEELKGIVSNNIRKLESVMSTLTMIVIQDKGIKEN